MSTIDLFLQILPLYVIIFIGFISNRKLGLNKETVSKILLYVIAPVVVFQGIYAAQLSYKVLLLPLYIFTFSCLLSLSYFYLAKKILPNTNYPNLTAFGSGTGNTGYFGFPVVENLLGANFLGLAVIANLGTTLFGSTLGFYLAAQGKFTARESLIKLTKLPALYALFLGLLFQYFEIKISASNLNFMTYFKGCFSVLGMMNIGMALSKINLSHINYKFIILAISSRAVVLPVITSIIVSILLPYNIIPDNYLLIILIFSCCPMGSDTVVIANEFSIKPEESALGVLISTLLALFIIPFVISMFSFI